MRDHPSVDKGQHLLPLCVVLLQLRDEIWYLVRHISPPEAMGVHKGIRGDTRRVLEHARSHFQLLLVAARGVTALLRVE